MTIQLRPRPEGDGHVCALPETAKARMVVMCRTCEKVWRHTLQRRQGRPDRYVWRRVRWLAWWYRLDAPAVPAHTLPDAHVRWIAPRGGGYRPGGDLRRDNPGKPFQGKVTPPKGGGGVAR